MINVLGKCGLDPVKVIFYVYTSHSGALTREARLRSTMSK